MNRATPFRVLLVEDDDADATLMRLKFDAFTHGPMFLARAGGLMEASHALSRTNYDAVILDLNLPDSPDAETTLRTVAQAAGHSAVILLSGSDLAPLLKVAIEQGIEGAFYKADDSDLEQHIYEAITRKRHKMLSERTLGELQSKIQELNAHAASQDVKIATLTGTLQAQERAGEERAKVRKADYVRWTAVVTIIVTIVQGLLWVAEHLL